MTGIFLYDLNTIFRRKVKVPVWSTKRNVCRITRMNWSKWCNLKYFQDIFHNKNNLDCFVIFYVIAKIDSLYNLGNIGSGNVIHKFLLRKFIWQWCLQNVSHFVQASICWWQGIWICNIIFTVDDPCNVIFMKIFKPWKLKEIYSSKRISYKFKH